MTLDDQLRLAAKNGLDSFSLSRLAFEWQANARHEASKGWSVRMDADPVVALQKALSSALVQPDPHPSRWELGGCLERLELALDDAIMTIRRGIR